MSKVSPYKRARQIECLTRLDELVSSIAEITGFLLDEKLISKDQFEAIRSSPMKGKDLQALLSWLSTSEKLQLLEYNWQLLPAETINIVIVTDTVKREFTYESF